MEFKNIVCPVGDEELFEVTDVAAAYLSRITDANLILVNVVEKWYRSQAMVTGSQEWQDIHKQWLDEGRQLLENEALKIKKMGGKHIETVLREGDAGYEIIALAGERKADLIIMATRHYSPIGKFFHGSVIDKVTRKSPCPILWLFK